MTDMTVSKTILSQLGGNRFAAMTGAKNFVGGDDYLMFSIGRNRLGANRCKIVLNRHDLYDITFLSIRGTGMKIRETRSDVFAHDLTEVIGEATGLVCRFPAIA